MTHGRNAKWLVCLSRALQRDDRQVLLTVMEVNSECESIAWLSGDKRARSGAGRAARPTLAWFDAWSFIGRSQAFGPSRHRWSAATVPIRGNGHVVILNDSHAATRQNATLMGECFHILLGHKPTRIRRCLATGLMRREFDRSIEQDAYWSAAAAFVPYFALRRMIDDTGPPFNIAAHFEVSVQLVEFRLKVTRLWRRTRRMSGTN